MVTLMCQAARARRMTLGCVSNLAAQALCAVGSAVRGEARIPMDTGEDALVMWQTTSTPPCAGGCGSEGSEEIAPERPLGTAQMKFTAAAGDRERGGPDAGAGRRDQLRRDGRRGPGRRLLSLWWHRR